MKKSELKQLIRETIEEVSMANAHSVLKDPSVQPLLRKLYDATLKGQLCDEDDINAAVIAAYKVGLRENEGGQVGHRFF